MTASPAALAEPTRVGRFELRRVLGKGAQATVWLAFDARLEREVAVKLLRQTAAGDAASVTHWLQEARSVSRLTHPNIVPVFEADVHAGQPYLVFEYVAGPTLAEMLRSKGPVAPREAVRLMIGVLDALAAAHASGVVHRDLKPSNILVDASARARVMDFGIAVRTGDVAQPAKVVGTPGYLSPEAALGEAPSPAMDVFSAGLVLAEMLSGKPLVAEKDPYRAIYRAAHEDLVLPNGMPAMVDDGLRAIVMRSLARDRAKRHDSATAFREALDGWLNPSESALAPGSAAAAASAADARATLDFLLRRMRHKTDFPALSDSVARIQKVANSENESLNSLANEILKDVALTNKLLRLVNTAHYSHAGGGSVSTISRAVALVGFAGIRNMALSLVLLEHMSDKSHAKLLREEFLRSLMAASVASELCPMAREAEEAFIGAMFQNLGRLLTEFYFPDEATQIRSLASSRGKAADVRQGAAEAAASFQVLGLNFESLGLGVARAWGLPDSLQKCMQAPSGEAPTRLVDKAPERMRWLTLAANDLTDTLLLSDPKDATAKLTQVAERYARALGVQPREILAATAAASLKLSDMSKAMSLHVSGQSLAQRLLQYSPGAQTMAHTDALAAHQLPVTEAPAAMAPGEGNVADLLAAGIQDITNTMVEEFRLNEVLRMVLETMFRALAFRRVVFCLRDPKTGSLTGRFGLGEGAEAVAAAFKLPLKGGIDLFSAVCNKGADTLISDSSATNIATRLPAWYRQAINAPTFLLLPMMMKGATLGLIYADKANAGGIELGDKELSLLRTLRNQAVMAFKQAG